MQTNISLLIDCVRGASKFLYRDYFELENLQGSLKSTGPFAQKSRVRVVEFLTKSLGKYHKDIIFDDYDNSSGDKNTLDARLSSSLSDDIALVKTLAGESNFQRSIPFFATIVTILTKKHNQFVADKIVINFPALGDIYYAQKNKGAWLERSGANILGGASRLRVSGNKKLEDSLVMCDYTELALAQKLSSNIRIFASSAYNIAMLASGKSDCAMFSEDVMTTPGLELLIHEAGGVSYLANGVFTGSNCDLEPRIKLALKTS